MHIVFEGGDSAGKSSSALRIADWLKDRLPKEYKIYQLHQPGDTVIGQSIRNLTKDPDNKMTSLGIFYGLLADAAQFNEERLKPLKDQGVDPSTYLIIQDRHSAISGYVSNVERYSTVTPEEYTTAYNSIEKKYPYSHPDIALILTLPAEQIIENLKQRGFTQSNRFEASHELEEWQKVVKAYENVPSKGTISSDKYITLDGDKKKPVLIANEVEAILGHKNMVDGPIRDELRNLYKYLIEEIQEEGIDINAKRSDDAFKLGSNIVTTTSK